MLGGVKYGRRGGVDWMESISTMWKHAMPAQFVVAVRNELRCAALHEPRSESEINDTASGTGDDDSRLN